MKCAVEMVSGAVICIPSLIKVGSGIREFIGWGTQDTQHGDVISLLLFVFKYGK
jgi:hypothetical protein